MLDIEITSKRVHYHLSLKKKITVIRGDSGKGKSVFTKGAGSSSGVYKKTLSDVRFSLQVIEGENWAAVLNGLIRRLLPG